MLSSRKRWMVVVLVMTAAFTSMLSLTRAQDEPKVACDSTTTLLYYIAAHDYGFEPVAVPAERYDKGQFTPLFEAIMDMGSADGMTEMMDTPMSDSMMTTLQMPVIEGEPAECTCLRAELESFFAGKFGFTHDMTMDTTMESGPAASSDMGMMDVPAWKTLPVVNAITGETFTLADYSGKTIYVEPFATWCSNCRTQLANVSAANANLGDEVVFVALSVETNLTPADLQAYQSQTGYDMIFAVATPELLSELVTVFGRTVVNPPATPHFIIRPDGTFTALETGFKDVTAITNAVGM